jgi:transcriptional regulator with XRE-family HTH domain
MPETIGHRLKKIRLSRQISIEKAAEATRVRAHYLQALEEDNYSVMSSAAQSRGFLRLYADFLDLDLEAAMAELRQSETVNAPPETVAPGITTPPPAPVSAPQTPPASLYDGKAVRRPFWARLLRRPGSERAADGESASESAPVAAEEPAAVLITAAEPVIVPEPEPELQPAPARAKKPAVKKASTSVKTSKPKTSKSKTSAKPTVKAEDKKKASLKSKPRKNHR